MRYFVIIFLAALVPMLGSIAGAETGDKSHVDLVDRILPIINWDLYKSGDDEYSDLVQTILDDQCEERRASITITQVSNRTIATIQNIISSPLQFSGYPPDEDGKAYEPVFLVGVEGEVRRMLLWDWCGKFRVPFSLESGASFSQTISGMRIALVEEVWMGFSHDWGEPDCYQLIHRFEN